MPFPFFVLVVPFVAGVWTAVVAPWPAAASTAALLLGLGSAWRSFLRQNDSKSFFFILAVSFTLGGVLYSGAERRFDRHPLRAFPADVYIDFEGTLAGTPSRGVDFDRLDLRLSGVVRAGLSSSIAGRIRISVPRSPNARGRRDLVAGDRVRISARILPLREYRNFDEPFSTRFLKTQGLQASAATKSPLLIEKLGSGPALSPLCIISRIRKAFLDRIETGFADPDAPGGINPEGAVFEALSLGERGRMSADVRRALQATGLFHLIAISGAHIGIIAALFFAVLRAARVPQRTSSVVLIGFLVAYAFLVEGRASVVRAAVMAGLYFAGRLLWKDVHLLNTLGLSAMAILVADPFQLLDMGFVLTYAATLSILLFYNSILRVLPKLPFKIGETLALSLAAQIGVLPFIAGAFHRVTFSGLLLNFLAVPLVGVIMAVGYPYLLAALAGDAVARAGGAVLRVLVDAFLRSMSLLDGVPFFSYRIPAPPLWVGFGYAAAMLTFLWALRTGKKRGPAGGAAVLFFLLLILHPFPNGSRFLRLTFIDVGQGDSILIEFPGREKMLIDGGGVPYGEFDIGENVVSPVLWAKGIKRVQTLVLTHSHPDHKAGLISVARNFRIGEFWEAPGRRPAEEDDLDRVLAKTPRWNLAAGSRRTVGGVSIDVLSPDADTAGPRVNENDRSLVLRLTYGKTSFLLAGDIETVVESRLVRSGRPLRSTVLKAPHHGSRTSSGEEFLAAVSPEIVVISAGRDNRYGLPNPEVIARYTRTGADIRRTDLQGAVEIESNGSRIRIRTAADRRFTRPALGPDGPED
jgi:competence protein ComEC